MEGKDLYALLCAPFETVHKDPRGLDYITGEQCITRLNDVLGVAGWSFSVVQHGYDQEADEMWVHGRLSAWLDGREVVREQFGSQKHNRRRAKDPEEVGAILDYGFDLKGAGTDCLKKCAAGLGVALYLAHKEAPGETRAAAIRAPAQARQSVPAPAQQQRPAPMPQQDAIPPREPAEERVVVAMSRLDRLKSAYDRGLQEFSARGGNLKGWSYQENWTEEDLDRYLGELKAEVDKLPKRKAGAAA